MQIGGHTCPSSKTERNVGCPPAEAAGNATAVSPGTTEGGGQVGAEVAKPPGNARYEAEGGGLLTRRERD